MSGHDNEDLIDYEDDALPTLNGAPSTGEGEERDKKNFSGIHSTGFRYLFTFAFHVSFSIVSLQGFSSQARVVACYQ